MNLPHFHISFLSPPSSPAILHGEVVHPYPCPRVVEPDQKDRVPDSGSYRLTDRLYVRVKRYQQSESFDHKYGVKIDGFIFGSKLGWLKLIFMLASIKKKVLFSLFKF